jgi:hypothetical protein
MYGSIVGTNIAGREDVMVQVPSDGTFAKPHRISRGATVGRVAWGVVYVIALLAFNLRAHLKVLSA